MICRQELVYMDLCERVISCQDLTSNYFRTAELLGLTYDEVRRVCEE